MTDRHENLRTALTEIAQRVDSVDLYDRAFARSSQIGRRRAAATVFAAAAAVVLISAGAWQILPRTSSAPQPPASPGLPSPTGLATPTPTSTPAADPTRGLGKATLRFPAWPRVGDLGQCSTGPVALVEGTHADNTKGVQIHLASATLTQLDGAPMYIAVVACTPISTSGARSGGTVRGSRRPGARPRSSLTPPWPTSRQPLAASCSSQPTPGVALAR